MHDTSTPAVGLPGADGLEGTLRALATSFGERKGPGSLLVMELRHTAVHHGPECEIPMADLGLLLRARIRSTDYMARLDDEGFGFVLPHATFQQASAAAARLVRLVRDHEVNHGHTQACIGVAELSVGEEPGSCLQRARLTLAESPMTIPPSTHLAASASQ